MAAGTVLALTRWPVKSMAGEPVAAVRVDARGVGGDRTHVLLDEFRGSPRRLTARETPRLLAWSARYPGAPDDELAPRARRCRSSLRLRAMSWAGTTPPCRAPSRRTWAGP